MAAQSDFGKGLDVIKRQSSESQPTLVGPYVSVASPVNLFIRRKVFVLEIVRLWISCSESISGFLPCSGDTEMWFND